MHRHVLLRPHHIRHVLPAGGRQGHNVWEQKGQYRFYYAFLKGFCQEQEQNVWEQKVQHRFYYVWFSCVFYFKSRGTICREHKKVCTGLYTLFRGLLSRNGAQLVRTKRSVPVLLPVGKVLFGNNRGICSSLKKMST